MKTLKWVNVSSIIMFTLSSVAWIFLATDYFKVQKVSGVDVKGAKIVSDNGQDVKIKKIEQVDRTNSILDEAMITSEAVTEAQTLTEKKVFVPKKEDGVGETYVRAKAAVAIDVGSETILHNQNALKRLPIASLTKLMTALVTVDKIHNLKSEVVTIDQEVCHTPTSIIGCPTSSYCFSDTLSVGEKVYAQDLLEAMLSNSANDAAVALGKHVAGSQKDFAKLMNKKAKEIGLKNTHFCNPSGLDDDDHPNDCYSSAEDVARIVVYALKNDKYKVLWPIFRVKERWFNSVDGKKKHRYASTNILLDTMSNCEGAKTGFTYEAGKTLMMIAENPKDKNKKVVAVILNDPYRFDDVQKLFNWIFENYNWKNNS